MVEKLDNTPDAQPTSHDEAHDSPRVGFIFHDQRILDEACNLSCGYCAPSGFPMKIDNNGIARMPGTWRETLKVAPIVDEALPEQPQLEDFFSLGRMAISSVEEQASAKILKLSGGEITLYPHLVNYVDSVRGNYSAVQILTNGYKLTSEQIDAFAEMGNVYFQISLDGTTQESNRARTPNGRITQKVLENIRRISEKGMPIEINCVLTKHNTGNFDLMLQDLNGIDDLVIIPRPVRGGGRQIWDFTAEQLDAFRVVVTDRYEEYSSILPPKVYLDRLVEMMAKGHRSDKCFVPFFVQGVDNYGNAETCSCGSTMPLLGNVIEDAGEVFDKHRAATNYDPEAKYQDCSYCTTQYELMNLYAEGAISREEMLRIPSFRFAGVLEEVEHIKRRLVETGALADSQSD